jgi:hypothetical protein
MQASFQVLFVGNHDEKQDMDSGAMGAIFAHFIGTNGLGKQA